jgi:hypothetical protein
VVSDNGNVVSSVEQLTNDVTVPGKLQNANLSPVQLAINDRAADIQAGLSTLVADVGLGEIGSITASNGPIVVLAATFVADQSALDKIVGGSDVSDKAANLQANLDQLNDPNISPITISDNDQISVSVSQLTNDATAIGKLQNADDMPVLLAVNDTAADIEDGLPTLVADAGRDRLDRRADRRFGGYSPVRSVDARQGRGRGRRLGFGGQSGGEPPGAQRRFQCGRHHGLRRRRDVKRRRGRECAEPLGGLRGEPHRRRGPRLCWGLQSGFRFGDGHNGREYAFADGHCQPERGDDRGRNAGAGWRERDDRARR